MKQLVTVWEYSKFLQAWSLIVWAIFAIGAFFVLNLDTSITARLTVGILFACTVFTSYICFDLGFRHPYPKMVWVKK